MVDGAVSGDPEIEKYKKQFAEHWEHIEPALRAVFADRKSAASSADTEENYVLFDEDGNAYMDAPPISDEHKQVFEAILQAENVCLQAGFYQNKPASIISFFSKDTEGFIVIHPVAVMLTPEMSAQLKDDIGNPLKPL